MPFNYPLQYATRLKRLFVDLLYELLVVQCKYTVQLESSFCCYSIDTNGAVIDACNRICVSSYYSN